MPSFADEVHILDDIVPALYDGDHLETDFATLTAMVGSVAEIDQLRVFLDEIAGSQSAMWKLAKWEAEHWTPHFNCKAINCFQQEGYNVYRIRPLKGRLAKHRVLYSYDGQRDEFHLLAAVLKPPDPLPIGTAKWTYYNYEADHPISLRVRNEYDQRGFTKIR